MGQPEVQPGVPMEVGYMRKDVYQGVVEIFRSCDMEDLGIHEVNSSSG